LPEVPPPGAGVKTLTAREPAVARSVLVIVARSWEVLTKVVVRLAPFQRTTEVLAKPLPLTVRVRAALPATALDGDRLLMAGTGGVAGAVVMVKVRLPEVPPPGAGVKTLTAREPAVARSVLVIVARSWEVLTKVVVRLAPFQRTTEVLAKPLPLTVSVSPLLPATALLGDRLLTVGTTAGAERALKVAVTVVEVFTVRVQVPVPEQGPLQPANVDPVAAAAVRVRELPTETLVEHWDPQEMPDGELVTVPEPVPFLVTVSVTDDVVVVVPLPLTPRETVSPPAVKVTLPAKVPTAGGRKRTVTVWLAPGASAKEPPETMLKGAAVLADPERLVLRTFWTVKLRSTVPLTATLPKVVVPVGVTVRSGWAAPLTVDEHALWLPAVSTAVTRTKYVAPVVSAVMVVETVDPFVGFEVGEATEWKDELGQVGVDVPR
jgi:hypothetical protein